MKLLWDTHSYLWFSSGSKEISEKVKQLIRKDDTENFISIASIWEITIKTGLGKISINGSIEDVWKDFKSNGIVVLPIELKHLKVYESLPFHHRDPFDRIIASQSIAENYNLLGKDDIFDLYLENSSSVRIW